MKKQLTLLILIFFIVACGGSKNEKSNETEKDKKEKIEFKSDKGSLSIDEEGGNMVIEGEDGSKVEISVGEGQSIPDDFPKDVVPVYKDAKIMATSRNLVDDKESYLISMGSEDSVDDIADFYKNKFSKKEIKTDINMNGMHMMAVEKDGYTISIQIVPSEDEEYGKSAANITVVKK